MTRRGLEIASEFSVRVRGGFDEAGIAPLLQAAAEATKVKGRVTEVALAGGEGSNRWLQLRCVGLRPREIKQLFDHCGLEANRILRTRFGPIAMDRSMARGRSRLMTDEELNALWEFASSQPAPVAESAGSRKSSR